MSKYNSMLTELFQLLYSPRVTLLAEGNRNPMHEEGSLHEE